MQLLTLDDIADLREYERVRDQYRKEIISLKKDRRVSVGPLLTLIFENRETMRFQIQEMARAEKMVSDDQIETELAIYNPLIPAKNELSATLFLELRTQEELMEWLPKLVGIEESVKLQISFDGQEYEVNATTDPSHKEQLTRQEMTASVHYIKFNLSQEQADAFAKGDVKVCSGHHFYDFETHLSPQCVSSLVKDWQ
ncbi:MULTISPECIES: DUF3501 family protein [Acidithrix]|uniref:DUF3501 family protein n=1 Tax=Acidithrix ferrooxidans TaxID=1280514 RepID=A0A0D8HDT2_9ACTN|nr:MULTISPECIES: DUF3501 family protein [Acidithrix]KJF16120.1 hypothetical protein AXFE_30260 [Acidithrix ferrooxidans]CAG4914418.1 unnamed protein product [Acidithrix sp. C25]